MKLGLNKRAQLVLKSLGLLSLSFSLLATSLISISSADENCSKSNLDRLAAEKIELQKIIDTEPENITFTVFIGPGETSTVTIGNVNRQINISSNLASGSFELLALKKNSKTIKFVFNTDEDGNKKFTTKRNLSGYRLVLKYNNEQIKSFAIN